MEITHETYWFAVGYFSGRSGSTAESPFTPEGTDAHREGFRLGCEDRDRAALSRKVPQTQAANTDTEEQE